MWPFRKIVKMNDKHPQTLKTIEYLTAEVRRLSGCLLVIAGAEGCGNGSLRTAAYEAATMGATVDNLSSKLGSPVPKERWAVEGWDKSGIGYGDGTAICEAINDE